MAKLPRLLWATLILTALACAQSPIANPGFEDGNAAEVPPGWRGLNNDAYSAKSVAEGCSTGKMCALLQSNPGATPSAQTPFGNLLQSFDATPFRGKKFRYRAAVRTEVAGTGNQAQMWLRVDRQGGGMGFFDNMGDRPIVGTGWKPYEISGEIDRDAGKIFLGVMLIGKGKAWVDDVSFEITGDADPVEPARALTAKGLDNMQAFARAFGYIRYFHPSDEAALADWNRVAADGARAVESAQTPAELAARLQSIFSPIAPSAQFFPTGSPAPSLNVKPTEQVVTWRHSGVGLSQQSAYWSKRVVAPASTAGELLKPLRADLPGGVTCSIPMALYRTSSDQPAPAPFSKATGSGNDRATRLAAVIVAWNVLQHFYPYFPVVKTDWPAELKRGLSQAALDNDAEAFQITLRKMVAALHDGHGNVSGGARGGSVFAPPVKWTWAEGRIVALSVKDLPDVHPGDALVSIDGRPAGDVLAEKEALISGATPQWIRYRALRELFTRESGSKVVVELETADKAPVRRTVTLECKSLTFQLQEPRPDKIKELEPGIFYVDMDRIDDSDFAIVAADLAKAKGIVFDMRGYPGKIRNIQAIFGHLTRTPMSSAQWNFPLTTKPDRQDVVFERHGEWQLEPVAPYFTAKRAFLIDGRAISYAESCMGIVENYKLAEIVGETTAGTNGNINPFTVPGGYTIVFTGMKVLKQDGSQHHGVGIHPTIPVSRTRAGIADGRDEILERGLAAVR